MIRYAIKKHMRSKGWENASQLAARAEIPAPLAYRIYRGAALKRIDVATLEHLARVFGVSPWELLEHKPTKPAKKPRHD